MTHPEVAILIVTYQSGDVIDGCITAAETMCAELVVIDNASDDGTQSVVARHASMSSRVRLVPNSLNRGFAAAVNQGVRATTAPFILLVNPDALIQNDIGPLVRACSEAGTGAAAGKLIDASGVPQRGFSVRRFPTPLTLIFENLSINRLWPQNPVNWRFRCFDLDLNRASDIDQPAGAFLMFRRDAWERLGGFDEGFFPLWFEDVDFCKRIRNAGMRILYEPGSAARHKGGHSTGALGLGLKTEYWYRSLLRYSVKHFGPVGRFMTCFSVIAGAAPRLVLGAGKHRFRDLYIVYRRLVSLALRCIWKPSIEFGEVLFLPPPMRKNSVSNDAK